MFEQISLPSQSTCPFDVTLESAVQATLLYKVGKHRQSQGDGTLFMKGLPHQRGWRHRQAQGSLTSSMGKKGEKEENKKHKMKVRSVLRTVPFSDRKCRIIVRLLYWPKNFSQRRRNCCVYQTTGAEENVYLRRGKCVTVKSFSNDVRNRTKISEKWAYHKL